MTPAIQAARSAGIRFEVHRYAHDPRAGAYGLEAATALGLDPACVYKTLVAAFDDDALVVAIVPVALRLNFKALAALAGVKKAAMADAARAEKATGYVRGGISPLGQRRTLPTYLDASALALDTVYVSAGRRGVEIELAPADLVTLTGAVTGGIAR